MKSKIKFRQNKYEEETKELREIDNRSLFEIASEWAKEEEEEIKAHPDDCYALNYPFICYQKGFLKAKSIIRQFLLNKQIGYGEAFFFKISEFDAIAKEKEDQNE